MTSTRRMIGSGIRATGQRAILAALQAVFVGATIACTVAPPTDVQKEAPSPGAQSETNLRRYVPDTVSEGWRPIFEAFPDPTTAPQIPGPNDIEAWNQFHAAQEQHGLKLSEEAVKQLQASVTSRELGGVPVLDVAPKGWVDNGKRLIYTHGGCTAPSRSSHLHELLSAPLGRAPVSQRLVWAHGVVPVDPGGDLAPRFHEVRKDVLPHTLLLETPEEPFNEPVLLRRIGRN